MRSFVKLISSNMLLADWFLIPFIVISFILMPLIGAGWDEQNNIYMGYRALRLVYFVFTGQLDQISLREGADDHGPASLFIPVIISKILGLRYTAASDGAVQYVFYCYNIALFTVSLRYLYLLMIAVSVRPIIALMGVICVALHPRLYFAAYNNSYDLNFLSFCIIMSYYCLKSLRYPSVKSMMIAGLMVGVCIDIRIVAVMFFAMTFTYGLVIFPRSQKKLLGYFVLMTVVATYLFCPILWIDPIDHLIWIWKQNSNIGWNGEVLYFGEMVKASELPWHYNFVWMGLTTPLFSLILIVLGVVYALSKLVVSPIRTCFFDFNLGWFLAWGGAPLIAPLVLQTTLFDGWRHHYFVYPAFVVLGCVALHKAVSYYRKPIYSFFAFTLVTGSCLVAVYSTFPHSNIYFNSFYWLTDKYKNDLSMSFEMDYWGVSYLEGLKAILALSDKDEIVVKADHMRPTLLNWKLLSDADRRRIQLISEGDSYDYFISNYRFRTKEFSEDIGKEVYSKTYLKTKYLTVRKRSDDAG